MNKSCTLRAIAFFLILVFLSVDAAHSQLNIFSVPSGRSGIGPSAAAGSPQDLFHIHGWRCASPLPQFLTSDYFDPTLRISLEDGNVPSHIFGQLSMQNFDDNTGTSIGVPKHSFIAKKYDFVLSTTQTFNPAFFNMNTGENLKSYTYDLILSTKSKLASIRFATTPPTTPLGALADREIMTITNTGNVGIGTPFPQPAELLNIHYTLPGSGDPPGPWPAIKLSINNTTPQSTDNPGTFYHQGLTLALCPADGYFGPRKLDGVLNVSSGDLILSTNKAPADPLATLRTNDDGGAIRFMTIPSSTPRTQFERVTILNNGNIGISNTTPNGLFQVGSSFLTVLGNGNVGINNPVPSGLFQVGINQLTVLSNGNVGIKIMHQSVFSRLDRR